MKRLGILLVVAMLGLVLACSSKEEEKAKQGGTPPAQGEKVAPQAPPATPAPTAPKPEHPK